MEKCNNKTQKLTGTFKTFRFGRKKSSFVKNTRARLDIEHEIFDMLDFGGQICNSDPGYDKDECVDQALEEKSLAVYGCTTPFEKNKNNICTDPNDIPLARNLSEKYYPRTRSNFDTTCDNPCSYMRLKITKIWEKNNNEGEGSIKLVFEENIKVTKAYYLYTEYILIAELGGYIGLFLGVSINQISDYLDTLCTWIYYRKK